MLLALKLSSRTLHMLAAFEFVVNGPVDFAIRCD